MNISTRVTLVTLVSASVSLLPGCGGGGAAGGMSETPAPATLDVTRFAKSAIAAPTDSADPVDTNEFKIVSRDDENPAAFDDVLPAS